MRLPARLLPALLIAAAALLLVVGVRMAGAGLAAYQAEAFMTHWAAQGREPDARAWAVAAAAAQRAVAWYPAASADYQDRLGRVHSWRFYQQPFGPAATLAVLVATPEVPAIDASRRQALAAYREAVRLRPAWADSQARLAHAKLYLLELDTEFARAYAAADRHAAAAGQVREELAQIGFRAWYWLTPAQQARALAAATAVLATSGPPAQQAVARQAAALGLLEGLCQRATARHGQRPTVCPAPSTSSPPPAPPA